MPGNEPPLYAKWLAEQINVEDVTKTLLRFPHVTGLWTPREREKKRGKPPFFQHYLDIIGGLYGPASRDAIFGALEEMTKVGSALPGWAYEKGQRASRYDYGQIQALQWELWVAERLSSSESSNSEVCWQKEGADFSLSNGGKDFQVECTMPATFHPDEIFVEDMLGWISARYLPDGWELTLERQHRLHVPFCNSKLNSHQFIEYLIDPVLKMAESGDLQRSCEGFYPKPLSTIRIINNAPERFPHTLDDDSDLYGIFQVNLEGSDPRQYNPTPISTGGHGDSTYREKLIIKVVENKQRQLQRRPGKSSIVAINLTSVDAQIPVAGNQWQNPILKKLQAWPNVLGIFVASVGIDGRVSIYDAIAKSEDQRRHVLQIFGVPADDGHNLTS